MSDTPRTDQLLNQIRANPELGGCMPKEFARGLERELREVAGRLASLRNSSGRIDLTDSGRRADVYGLVALGERIIKRHQSP